MRIADIRWSGGGIPVDFWVTYDDLVTKIVETHALTAVPERYFGTQRLAETETLPYRVLNPRGGMRAPHFHTGDQIYLVPEKAWAEFTREVKRDLSEKLAKVRRVSFDELAHAFDVVSQLG